MKETGGYSAYRNISNQNKTPSKLALRRSKEHLIAVATGAVCVPPRTGHGLKLLAGSLVHSLSNFQTWEFS